MWTIIAVLALLLIAASCTRRVWSVSSAGQPRDCLIIAHRAGAGLAPENSLSAVRRARELGVDAIEVDVRLTADGELVILHDASLKRMTDVDMNVEKSTRKEIKKVKTKQGNPILFVDELVDYFRGSDIAYIEWEMKSNNYSEEQLKVYCDKAYKTVMKGKPENALYIFSSFDHRSLRIMKELHPDAVCMLITGEAMNEKTIETTKSLGLNRVACGVEGTSRRAMTEAHKQGLIVNLWPGGSVEDFQLALALGADIACTDYPVKVLEFVKEKMPWITPRKSLK